MHPRTNRRDDAARPPAAASRPPRTLLSRNGYGLAKDQCTGRELQRARKELTVSPFVMRGFGPAKPRAYPIYRENDKRLYVPRHYGIAGFGDPDDAARVGLGDPAPRLRFKGTLRPLQRQAVAAFEATLGPTPDSRPTARYPHGGIMSLACGQGKTILALYIAALVGRKTLVVVHKEFLMHQWHERIRQFLPGATVGLIQQKKVDVRGKDVVLAMLQSLSVRDYPADVLAPFGLVVCDECHHLSSEMFCRALPKIGARVTLGLSATPQRADGLTKVFKWYLGDVLFKSARRATTASSRAWRASSSTPPRGYGEELVVRYPQREHYGMINNIAGDANRTASWRARPRARRPAGRQLLVLSGRRQHLEDIHEALVAQLPDGAADPLAASVGYYVGGMNQDALKASESCRVVLATYTMAAEGLDIKTLNTLMLATPMSNVTQAVGRILRAVDPATPPLVVDLVDDFSVFARQGEKRLRVYRRENFDAVATVAPDGRPRRGPRRPRRRRGGDALLDAKVEARCGRPPRDDDEKEACRAARKNRTALDIAELFGPETDA